MHIIGFIRDSLTSCDIMGIEGVLNGTCNYILTRMEESGYSYADVLEEAKELGLAESDPTYDVEGIDTACKLAILACSIFGMDVTYKDVETTGITNITPEAMTLAMEDGYTIKLIGEVRRERLKVAPRLVPKDSPLNVRGSLNVAAIETDIAKTITLVGRGAGPTETASAVLSDIIWLSRRWNS